jgi:hypothetical protein
MTSPSTHDFYAALPPFSRFDDVCDDDRFSEIPSDWDVVITDIQGSTQAIEAGRYKDVNAVGACSIIAALNATSGAQIPYVFGGDGATLLIPSALRPAVAAALTHVRKLARDQLSLTLRVGIVPAADLPLGSVRVAKFQASAHVQLAMFSGGGLTTAEKLVKDPTTAARYALSLPDPIAPDPNLLAGFECRWDPLQSRRGLMVSALISTRRGPEVYRRVLDFISSLSHASASAAPRRDADGADNADNAGGAFRPADSANLRLATTAAAFRAESRLRAPQSSARQWLYAQKLRFITAIGRRLVRVGATLGDFDGARYPAEVAANTDFRKFDDTLRMVLDLSTAHADALQAFLAAAHAQGDLFYGLHRAPAALMTCMIRSYQGHHLHFIDGADGGYALAAKQLKRQLADAQAQP